MNINTTERAKARLMLENEEREYLRISWPSAALRTLVAYYFEVKNSSSTLSPHHLYSIPNLQGLLCFSLNEHSWISIDQKNHQVITLKGFQMLGPLTRPLHSVFPSRIHSFYIKFQPGVLEKIAHLLPGELHDANTAMDGHLIENKFMDHLLGDISFEQRIAYAEAYLQPLLHIPLSRSFSLVQEALHLFSKNPNQNIEIVADTLAVSYRTLHRYFTQELHFSPKYCQKIIRLKQALYAYRKHGYQPDYSDLGYTDFSHFCKEAKEITLRSPSEI